MLTRLAEDRYLPDSWIRHGIRRLLGRRLDAEEARHRADHADLLAAMRDGPIAEVPGKANQQHYEVPPDFFRLVLGPRLKYSGCYWPEGVDNLAQAEESMLELTCERAGIVDGQRILELGCGWGSLTLWLAERYPAARVTAVSNSAPQRRFIEERARRMGLSNLEVVTSDMNDFDTSSRFDRVVSVEMFEHMRNQEELLRRVASWLAPDGRVFLHVFCHRRFGYLFETDGKADWMARHFFTGGMMPALDLFEKLEVPLEVQRVWRVGGEHYQKTAEAWLELLDRRQETVREVLEPVYGEEAERWLQRWRMFFMACAELFGYDGGRQWLVGHYLLQPATEEAR